MKFIAIATTSLMLLTGCQSLKDRFNSDDMPFTGTWTTALPKDGCKMVLEIEHKYDNLGEFTLLRMCNYQSSFIEKTSGEITYYSSIPSLLITKKSTCTTNRSIPFLTANLTQKGDMILLTNYSSEIRMIRMSKADEVNLSREYTLGCEVKNAIWRPFAMENVY